MEEDIVDNELLKIIEGMEKDSENNIAKICEEVDIEKMLTKKFRKEIQKAYRYELEYELAQLARRKAKQDASEILRQINLNSEFLIKRIEE